MNEINIEAKLVKAVSQKSGDFYYCVDLFLPNGYKTRLFFNRAESFIVSGCFE